jgi:hypothetical protein
MHQQILIAHGAASTPPTTWNAAVAATSPWGWWKLDEVAGAAVTAPDSSGNGRDGTYTAAGSQTTGLFAGSTAAQLTLGGRVTLPSYTTPATPAFSVCAFVRTSHVVNAERQICSADNASTGRIFQFRKDQGSGARPAQAVVITPSSVTLTGTVPINDGNSHLVIFVFDQSLAAGSGRMKIYVDGVLDVASSTSVTISSGLSCPIGIGSRYGGANTGLWQESIDETIFYDRALSSTEIANLNAAKNS